MLDARRGVVLETQDGQMLVQPARDIPRWVDDIGAAPGAMVVKERWQWSWRVDADRYRALSRTFADALRVRTWDVMAREMVTLVEQAQ